MKEYIGCLKKYAVFAGRARRREYWMFVLFNAIVSYAISFILGIIAASVGNEQLALFVHLYTLAALLPSWAVCIRRLHDIGKSGWWILIGLIPIIGWILLLVYVCRDSQPGDNAYGPNPKGA